MILPNFSQKLYENEKMLGRRGAPALDPRLAQLFEMYTLHILGVIAMGPCFEAPMSLQRCQDGHQGNATMIPVLDTLHDVPWTQGNYKTGSVLCETKYLNFSPQEACPRY